jgi:glycosyl hydrolase family 76
MSVWQPLIREPFRFMHIRIRRSLFSFALCVAALLIFPYALEVHSSSAQGHSAPARMAAVPQIHAAARDPGAPSFAVAAREGIAELLGSGDHSIVGWRYVNGLWGGHIKPNWWQSALAMLTLVRYAERTHSLNPRYQSVLLRIYARNIYKPLSTARRDFANEFNDDTAWWGLAWLEASKYELYVRHDYADAAKFLAVAEWDARYINGWPRPCGGIGWAINRPPDTVTSAEFVALTAELTSYRNTPGRFYDPEKASTWLGEATTALAWLEQQRLVSLRAGWVMDGMTDSCKRKGGAMTYTEGEMADALVQLGNALHDRSYYTYAANFLRYPLTPRSRLITHGVLQERCERLPSRCGQLGFRLDLPAYKGILVNAVVDWSNATGSSVFRPFLLAQARAVVNNTIRGERDEPARCATPQTCQFAFSWAGRAEPPSLGVTLGGQESGIDALTAMLPQRG